MRALHLCVAGGDGEARWQGEARRRRTRRARRRGLHLLSLQRAADLGGALPPLLLARDEVRRVVHIERHLGSVEPHERAQRLVGEHLLTLVRYQAREGDHAALEEVAS